MLKESISLQIKEAMKSGDKLRLETLRSIRASIIEFEKSGVDREMTTDDEISILTSLVKKRKDAAEQYSKAGRNDLSEKETKELEIIQTFLPKQLSREEIEEIINKLITLVNAKSMSDLGKVMGPAMTELKGRADGKIVNEIVKLKLSANA
ncbi:MAG: GatB/YqeY domain-containing protein [Ignavibacteria bacterium]|nr:GatB/YqeY domain-containing protein [Ignavibacteria bacterium]